MLLTMKGETPVIHIDSGCPCTRGWGIPHKPGERYQLQCTAASWSFMHFDISSCDIMLS